MKFSFNEVFNIYNVITSVKSNTFKANYWLSRNIKVFQDTFFFILKSRDNVYKEFLEKDEDGEYFKALDDGNYDPRYKERTPENISAFKSKLEELFNTECELEPYLISSSALMESDLEISLEQVMIIDKLLKD